MVGMGRSLGDRIRLLRAPRCVGVRVVKVDLAMLYVLLVRNGIEVGVER